MVRPRLSNCVFAPVPKRAPYRSRRSAWAHSASRSRARSVRSRAVRGLTLLELLLALSLSVLIIAAVGMAIELQLRTLETRRTYLEEAQIARAILRMIADDLRSAVAHEPQDFSAVEQMLASAAGDAAQDLLGDPSAGGDAGGGQAGGADGGLPGGGDGGAGDGGGGRGDSGGGGDSPPPPSPDGGDLGTDDPLLDEMQEDPSLDIASSVTPPPQPGLYGNPFELQVDISRLPRVDELRYGGQTAYGAIGSMAGVMPSDVRTVAWYVQGATPAGGAATPLPAANNLVLGEFGEASSGLVRRELGRSVTQWAVNNGGQQLAGAGELLAPEVTALQFQYFDGYSWYPEWNSESLGGLPLAVEITLFMQPRDTQLDESGMPVLDPALLDETSAGLVQGQLVYRMVVRIPVAQPAQPLAPTEGGELEALGL